MDVQERPIDLDPRLAETIQVALGIPLPLRATFVPCKNCPAEVPGRPSPPYRSARLAHSRVRGEDRDFQGPRSNDRLAPKSAVEVRGGCARVARVLILALAHGAALVTGGTGDLRAASHPPRVDRSSLDARVGLTWPQMSAATLPTTLPEASPYSSTTLVTPAGRVTAKSFADSTATNGTTSVRGPRGRRPAWSRRVRLRSRSRPWRDRARRGTWSPSRTASPAPSAGSSAAVLRWGTAESKASRTRPASTVGFAGLKVNTMQTIPAP